INEFVGSMARYTFALKVYILQKEKTIHLDYLNDEFKVINIDTLKENDNFAWGNEAYHILEKEEKYELSYKNQVICCIEEEKLMIEKEFGKFMLKLVDFDNSFKLLEIVKVENGKKEYLDFSNENLKIADLKTSKDNDEWRLYEIDDKKLYYHAVYKLENETKVLIDHLDEKFKINNLNTNDLALNLFLLKTEQYKVIYNNQIICNLDSGHVMVEKEGVQYLFDIVKLDDYFIYFTIIKREN
ncbi:9379_t:CDS:2, partial [Dentiscutata heterogama]